MSEMKMIELRDLLVSAFLSGYGRADSEGLTRREYLDCSLRAIASMQVEPETVYCEEGTALQDELDLDHLEDGMHADGTWLYYGKPDEGFFFLLWFEDEGEAMTKQAQLSADPAVCCWLVDLEKELERIAKEREKAAENLARIEQKLRNEKFVSKAPEAVVNAEREKAEKARTLIAKLDESAAAMRG